jgi:hypothetical protein
VLLFALSARWMISRIRIPALTAQSAQRRSARRRQRPDDRHGDRRAPAPSARPKSKREEDEDAGIRDDQRLNGVLGGPSANAEHQCRRRVAELLS